MVSSASQMGSGPGIFRAGPGIFIWGPWGHRAPGEMFCFWNLRPGWSWPKGLGQNGRHCLLSVPEVRDEGDAFSLKALALVMMSS